jgi:alkane 1-monooxygenase
MNIPFFKFKSLLGLTVAPVVFFISLAHTNVLAYAGILAIPAVAILDLLLPRSLANPTKEQEKIMESDHYYNVLVWLVAPTGFFCLIYFLVQINQRHSVESMFTLIGWTLSMALVGGIWGIAVGHELGHRTKAWEVYMGKMLLFISLRMTFMTFHNYGHHSHVGTPKDPTSSRRNEWSFIHVPKSLFLSWIEAWKIQRRILKSKNINFFSPKNNVFWFTVIQWAAIIAVLLLADWQTALAFVCAGLTGSLLFELINYVEHYGLMRRKLSSGVYERVLPVHSWNDSHSITGSILLNGMRHSDHHSTYSRPYQLLRNCEEIPTNMPFNSAAMMLLALFPPLFFLIMNPKLDQIELVRDEQESRSNYALS